MHVRTCSRRAYARRHIADRKRLNWTGSTAHEFNTRKPTFTFGSGTGIHFAFAPHPAAVMATAVKETAVPDLHAVPEQSFTTVSTVPASPSSTPTPSPRVHDDFDCVPEAEGAETCAAWLATTWDEDMDVTVGRKRKRTALAEQQGGEWDWAADLQAQVGHNVSDTPLSKRWCRESASAYAFHPYRDPLARYLSEFATTEAVPCI
jgi:hypothetical protein